MIYTYLKNFVSIHVILKHTNDGAFISKGVSIHVIINHTNDGAFSAKGNSFPSLRAAVIFYPLSFINYGRLIYALQLSRVYPIPILIPIPINYELF